MKSLQPCTPSSSRNTGADPERATPQSPSADSFKLLRQARERLTIFSCAVTERWPGGASSVTSTRLDRTQSGGSVWRDAHTLDSRRIRTSLLRLQAGLAGAVGSGQAARQDGECPGGRAGADAAGQPRSSGARNGVHGQADQAQGRGGSGARRQPHLR
jgi:hypothetical protein